MEGLMKKILIGSVMFLLVVVNNVMAVTTGAVQGKVVDAFSGKPIAGAQVIATLYRGPSDILEEQKYNKIVVKTDKNGKFQFKGLSTNYNLSIYEEGYLSGGEEKFGGFFCNIPAKTTKLLGELRLYPKPKRFKVLDGVVFDEDTGLWWSSAILNITKAESIQDAENMISSLINERNNSNFAGFNNWRLPKQEELLSICRLFMSFDVNQKMRPGSGYMDNYFHYLSFYKMVGFAASPNNMNWFPSQIFCSAMDGKIIAVQFWSSMFCQIKNNIGDHIGRVYHSGVWLVRDKNPVENPTPDTAPIK